MNLRIIFLSLLACVCINGIQANDLPDAGTLRGIHWKTYTVPVFNPKTNKLISATVEAKPDLNLTNYQKIELFASTGLNCIGYKLEDGGQLTTEFPGSGGSDDKTVWNALSSAEKNILNAARAQGAYEFAKAAAEWNANNPDKKVYIVLFTRKWFQRNGTEIAGGDQEAAQIFADVINRCVAEQCDQAIIGVLPVETRIDGMDQLLPAVVQFADAMNAQTNNWLKNKILFFSGLGMGISFKGYRGSGSTEVASITNCEGSTTFWNQIQSRCAGFSWVYKHFTRYDNEPTFEQYVKDHGVEMDSYANCLNMVLNVFGLSDLNRFIQQAPGEAYNNVLFWGDASDGIRHLSNNVRDAIKATWIHFNFKAASFFHFTNKEASYETVWADKNSLWTIQNNRLGENSSLTLWQTFMDGNKLNPFNKNNNLDIVTSLPELSGDSGIKVYTRNKTLYIQSTTGMGYSFTVYDSTGKTRAKGHKVTHNSIIPLPQGPYIVMLNENDKASQLKVVL